MTTLSIRPAPGVTTGRPRSLARRVFAWLTAPSLHELDTRMLADIGASQTLRAQAELREAWRETAGTSRWHGL